MKRKYEKGKIIKTFLEFSECYESQKPIYRLHKFTSFGWYQNWQIRMVNNDIKSGMIFHANKLEEK